MSTNFSHSSIGDRKILVAVDFGTTCSGLAWAQTKKPKVHSVIQEWPEIASTDDKVPTTLKHDHGSYRWGFQIRDDEQKHEWFKLGLDRSHAQTDLAVRFPSRTALPLVYGKECEDLIVEYLTHLRKHAEKVLKDYIGSSVLNTTPREYIITVPAVWSDGAQEKTRSCARKAGMCKAGEIQIMTEPEAAGIYALDTIPPHHLDVNDTFVICDAGGGTVDLVSYTVTARKPVAQISETTPGTGELCGSTFLNRIFAKYLEDKFINYLQWDAELQAEALRRFENEIKRNFAGANVTKEYIIPARGLTDNLALGISNNKLVLSGHEIGNVFEPVISKIVKLVQNQIAANRKPVKAVLLAGGFGRNNYLFARLNEAVGDKIEVRKVTNGNTSIVRGALIKGLTHQSPTIASVRVESRKARKHYGTCCFEQFNPERHDHRRKVENPFYGGYRVQIMKWFIEKGSSVRESVPNTFAFYHEQKVSEGKPGVVEMVIYICEDLTNMGAPLYKGEGVSDLVKLKADLGRITNQPLNQEIGQDGRQYYKIDFEIEMTCHSASITFALVYGNKSDGEDFNFWKQL